MRKLYLIKLSVIILSLYFTSTVFSATITSTAEGGPWPESSTWIGGYVPGPFDDVIINGPVKASQSSCNNITVNPSGTLLNWGENDTLFVLGNIINNGVITNFYNFILLIGGDITNNGDWQAGVYTYLTGNSDHHITSLNNHSFNMSLLENTGSGNIYVDSFASFDYVILQLNNDTLFVADNATLEIKQQHVDDGYIVGEGNSSVVKGINVNNSGPAFNSVSFRNVTLEGINNLGADCITHGTVINNGILQNNWYTRTLTIADGVFINNDTLTNNNQWLNVDLYSNFINYGYVAGYTFSLKSAQDQYISQGNNGVFACSNFKSDKSGGKIHFLSDISFLNCHLNIQNDTILVADSSEIELNSSELANAVIDCEIPDGMLKINVKNNSYIYYNYISNTEFLGKAKLGNNDFYGEILVTDTIQNPFGSSTINVHGNITNNGLVTSYYSSFILNVEGDITNNGIWQCAETNMTGTNTQHIDYSAGNILHSNLTFVSDLTGSSYQWYFNDSPILSSSPCFYGETSNILHLGNNISSCYDGAYYCMVDGAMSRKIMINTREISVNARIYIEGAFNGNDMNTTLGMKNLVPLSQPYNIYPWNYGGTESVSVIPDNTVDWILVELYDTTDVSLIKPSNKISSQAAFLLSDGSIVNTSGTSVLSFFANIQDSLFLVVCHRNHLSVLSANALTESSGIYYYDFTINAGRAYQSGQKTINGKAVMYGGDTNADGSIDDDDINPDWVSEAGKSGYLPSDVNLDGQSDNKDKNDIWVDNNGTSSTVPD
jgi:hypothetical protein